LIQGAGRCFKKSADSFFSSKFRVLKEEDGTHSPPHMHLEEGQAEGTLTVNVQSPSGDVLRLQLEEDQTVEDVKLLIRARQGIACWQQSLFCAVNMEDELEADSKLCERGVNTGATIYVVYQSKLYLFGSFEGYYQEVNEDEEIWKYTVKVESHSIVLTDDVLRPAKKADSPATGKGASSAAEGRGSHEQENTLLRLDLTLDWTLDECPHAEFEFKNDHTEEIEIENMQEKIGQHAQEFCEGP
jgi:hypothetical protein